MDAPMKRCRKCGIEYPATPEYFFRAKRGKYGVSSWCKGCKTAANRAWYEDHKEQHHAVTHKWYEEHRQQVLASQAEYRATHKDEIAAYQREYGERNRAKIKEYHRQYYVDNKDKVTEQNRQWYINNPDKHNARTRRWRRANPERTRAAWGKRRAHKIAAGGTFTHRDVDLQYKAQRGKCWWCACSLEDRYHIDHLVPLSRGGSNAPSNIVLACPSCNCSKGAKMPHEWNGRLL